MAAQQYRTLKGGNVIGVVQPVDRLPSPRSELGKLPGLRHGSGQPYIAFADQYGTPGHEVYGLISVGFVPGGGLPSTGDNLTLTHGVTLSYGDLNIFGDIGGGVTLDGASTVTNDSTFTATGGRSLVSPFVLNGSMTVSNQSTADFHNATLEGHGTVNIEAGSTVDMSTVLRLRSMWPRAANSLAARQWSSPTDLSFQGTINEAAGDTFLFMERSRRPERSFTLLPGRSIC